MMASFVDMCSYRLSLRRLQAHYNPQRAASPCTACCWMRAYKASRKAMAKHGWLLGPCLLTLLCDAPPGVLCPQKNDWPMHSMPCMLSPSGSYLTHVQAPEPTWARAPANHQAACCIPELPGYPDQPQCCARMLTAQAPAITPTCRLLFHMQDPGHRHPAAACCIPEMPGHSKLPRLLPLSVSMRTAQAPAITPACRTCAQTWPAVHKTCKQLAASPQRQALQTSCIAVQDHPHAHTAAPSSCSHLRALSSPWASSHSWALLTSCVTASQRPRAHATAPSINSMMRALSSNLAAHQDPTAACCIPTCLGSADQLQYCILAPAYAHPKHQLLLRPAGFALPFGLQQEQKEACCIPTMAGSGHQLHACISAPA